jgi:hypothetical protein
LWKDHPEKALGMRASWVDKYPNRHHLGRRHDDGLDVLVRVDAAGGEPVADPEVVGAEQLITQGIGYTALTTGELWKDHPEKALGMRASWVDKPDGPSTTRRW